MTHDDLILFLTTLGYKKPEAGVCHGFTLMWVQAACNHQLDAFYERLEFLDRFVKHPDRLTSAIAAARQKVVNKTRLTPEDEQLLELPAFFDGISLYQEVQHSREIAHFTGKQFQNIEPVSLWIQPNLAPDRLHKVSCAGQYTESEFSDFLTQLAKVLENQPDSVLTATIPSHTLGLLYKGEGIFEVIDTNEGKIAPLRLSPKECADFLFNYAFEYELRNEKLLIRTTAFATNTDNLPDLSWEHEKKYTQLHKNPNNTSLLEMALRDDDLMLWDQLHLKDVRFEELEVRVQNVLLRDACLRDSELMVRLFLKKGIKNYQAHFEQTGFLAVIENPQITALLLQHGITPNTVHPKRGSPLQSAVTKNNPELVQLLLSYGTTIDYATDTLHLAAERGYQELVRILVSHFPQLARMKDKHQLRPLDYAILNRHHDLILELLPHTPMQPNAYYHVCSRLETEDKGLKKRILIEAFSSYITQRQQESKPLSTFFSRLGQGYTAPEKIAVATKVLEFLKSEATELELNPQELNVLNNGRLHWLLRAVREHLGPDFEIKEKSLKEQKPFLHKLCRQRRERERPNHEAYLK